MVDNPDSCPKPDQLRALIDGTLTADEQQAIQSHVDGCSMCGKTLESLVAGGASWDVAVDHLKNDSPQPNETILSDAIERLKADPFAESAAHASASVNPLDFLAPSDQPGSIGKLGMYEVTEVIGQGGMGIVLKAFDPALHRVVAVKILAPYLAHSPQARKRFVREAQAIAAVTHEHVITIHSIDESAEQPKIVMQYVAGQSLQQKLDTEGSLDLKEILRIGMQTASGLAAAHAQGLVHRDVKPSNILLENGIQRVKLTDFGLARAVDDASLTQSGVIAGTPQYMAPEQANGDAVDFRADLFSLGSVLYAMCVGHSPFRASTTMGVLKRVCHDPPRPIRELNPDIPDWLGAIVMKLLEKQPEDRFPSAKVVAELLEKWLAHVQRPQIAPKPQQMMDAFKPTPKKETIDVQNEKIEIHRPDWLPKYFNWPLSPYLVAIGISIIAAIFFRAAPIEIPIWAGATWFVTKTIYSWPKMKFTTRESETQIPGSEQSPPNTEDWTDASRIPWWVLIWILIGFAIRILPTGVAEFLVLWVACTIVALLAILIGYVWKSVNQRDAYKIDAAMSSNGLLQAGPWLWIGWYVVGALDLVLSVTLSYGYTPNNMAAIWFFVLVIWLGLAAVSFVISHCIYVRQNLILVERLCYLGLLPVTFGAFVRIPLSIITLLWQSYPSTRATFEQTPWPETQLGCMITSFKNPFFRKTEPTEK